MCRFRCLVVLALTFVQADLQDRRVFADEKAAPGHLVAVIDLDRVIAHSHVYRHEILPLQLAVKKLELELAKTEFAAAESELKPSPLFGSLLTENRFEQAAQQQRVREQLTAAREKLETQRAKFEPKLVRQIQHEIKRIMTANQISVVLNQRDLPSEATQVLPAFRNQSVIAFDPALEITSLVLSKLNEPPPDAEKAEQKPMTSHDKSVAPD